VAFGASRSVTFSSPALEGSACTTAAREVLRLGQLIHQDERDAFGGENAGEGKAVGPARRSRHRGGRQRFHATLASAQASTEALYRPPWLIFSHLT